MKKRKTTSSLHDSTIHGISIVDENTSNVGDKKKTPQRQQRTLCLSSVESSKNTIKFVSQDKFNQRIVNFVVNGLHSLSIVDEKDFKNVFNDFGVEVFSRRTLDRKIDDHYLLSVEKIKCFLSQHQYVCTTTDIWSMKSRSLIGVTAHVLNDKDFNRISIVLACTRFPGVHSFNRIAEILHSIHLMYDLPVSKIVATVTDNSANFVKAFKEFGIQNNNESEYDEFNEEEVLQFVDVQSDAENNSLDPDAQYTNATLAYHQRCATHTLNLIASSDINICIKNNTALKRLHHPALAKCTLLWNASGRPKSAETIYSILGFKLSYPCVIRWNSLYDSLCLIIKAKEKLNSVFESLGSNTQFKSYALEYLSDYIDIVKPISIALDKLQGEQNCYYGQLIPTLFALKTKYKKMLVLSSMPGSMTPTENRSLDRILNIRPQTSLVSDILVSLKKRFKNYYEVIL